ncbi:MAG: hypothetical protein R6U55_12290 [Desulfovermiculus sp.]
MTLMVVFLLALNFVLAAGLIILWLQYHTWSEKSEEVIGQVQNEIHDLEARMTHMEKTAQSQGPDSEWPKDWFLNPLPGRSNHVPERYRLAINMADNGMDVTHLTQALGVSKYEADQLANLARLAQQSKYQDVQDQALSKDSDPE